MADGVDTPIVGTKIQPERVCSRAVDPTDADTICGRPAVMHAVVILTDGDLEGAYVCQDHILDCLTIFRRYGTVHRHVLGCDCGMPGSLFFIEHNRCIVPEGGIPVAETTRKDTNELTATT